MLFQKEKEDKNQINRLDQKRERRSRRAFFLLSPISRKTLSGKVSLCTFLKKASLTLETAMALPLFFFGVLTLLSFMDIYKVQTEHLTGLCQKAKEAGCQEAVFHRGDRVTECAHSYCHILKDGILYTAPADNLILPGIARAHLIRICKKLEIPVSETPYTLKEMMDADEVLVTSSTKLCVAANEIDGTPGGGRAPETLKNILDAVMDEYMEETKA